MYVRMLDRLSVEMLGERKGKMNSLADFVCVDV